MASNAPRRSLRSNHELTQNTLVPSQPEPLVEGSSSELKRRGKAVNEKKYKVKKDNGGIVPIQFSKDYLKPVGEHSEIWDTELGILVRENIPLCFESWPKVPEYHRQCLYQFIKTDFGIDCNADPKLKKLVNTTLANDFKTYRHTMKKHFKKFESEESGRSHPYPYVSNEDWQMLCDRWTSTKFQEISSKNTTNRGKLKVVHCAGSKSFAKIHYELKTSSINDEDSGEDEEHHLPGPAIQMYRKTHYKDGTGWIHEDARKAYEDMMAAQSSEGPISFDIGSSVPIDEQILENRLGIAKGQYFRGFGYGKAPSSSSRKRKTTGELEAERRAEQAEQERDATKEELSQLKESMNEMKKDFNTLSSEFMEYKRMSSQFISTQFGAYGPLFGNPQQQQPPTYGPFGSLLNLQPPFGPYPPFQSQPPTDQ